jgi:hypothetical protein
MNRQNHAIPWLFCCSYVAVNGDCIEPLYDDVSIILIPPVPVPVDTCEHAREPRFSSLRYDGALLGVGLLFAG